jgi:release factor glutamine methyltransferase
VRWLDAATSRLAAAGVPSPRCDAEELAALALHTRRRDLSLPRFRELADAPDGYEALVDSRAQRVPLQHLTGHAAFRYSSVRVGPGVFIPRPETEVMVGWAVEWLCRAGPAPLVVDLFSGSGVIAVSVAAEVPTAKVHAVEISAEAHGWAQRNVANTSVTLHLGDAATALPELNGKVDLVIANPPYIPLGAHIRDPEVTEYDPALALWSGKDGLDAMRVLEAAAARLLRPSGQVAAEHADSQGQVAPAVFTDAGRWREVVDHTDLADRPRFLTATFAGGHSHSGERL